MKKKKASGKKKAISNHVMPEWFFPYWRCKSCGRKYTAFENVCLFCKEKPKRELPPPRHQYREIPTQEHIGRTYYESDINLDFIPDWDEYH